MAKTALITGTSSGFGLLTSITLAQRGWHVIATMRDLGRREQLDSAAQSARVQDRIEIRALDVTNSDQIASLAAEIGTRPAPLDALVNNAGFAIAGFADDVTDAELRLQFETNFFGAAAVTRAFLPQFRRQGMGHIVMVSSISGRVGFPGVSSYAASKFALEGWAETLRFELKALGINVVIVEPGSFETDIWTRNAKISARMQDPASPNASRIAAWRTRMENAEKRGNPQLVADTVASILENPKPKLRYPVGRDARFGVLMQRFLPSRLFERLVIRGSCIDK